MSVTGAASFGDVCSTSFSQASPSNVLASSSTLIRRHPLVASRLANPEGTHLHQTIVCMRIHSNMLLCICFNCYGIAGEFHGLSLLLGLTEPENASHLDRAATCWSALANGRHALLVLVAFLAEIVPVAVGNI